MPASKEFEKDDASQEFKIWILDYFVKDDLENDLLSYPEKALNKAFIAGQKSRQALIDQAIEILEYKHISIVKKLEAVKEVLKIGNK